MCCLRFIEVYLEDLHPLLGLLYIWYVVLIHVEVIGVFCLFPFLPSTGLVHWATTSPSSLSLSAHLLLASPSPISIPSLISSLLMILFLTFLPSLWLFGLKIIGTVVFAPQAGLLFLLCSHIHDL